jgi:chemotaxis protein MotA
MNVDGQLKDEFARKGLQLAGRRRRAGATARGAGSRDLDLEQEMKLSARIWEAAGGYSPTIGILGAVWG